MKQAAVWTNKQKQFVRNAYRDTLQYPTSFTRDERIKKITEVLNTTFQTNKTPSAVRGAIERTRKDLER
ncbi:MAG: hypothetical protein LBG59_01370 [Candidatus Peribacteria bacterium]|jgi:ribosomal 50S subunit-associated protein YjgA (DUF615 family)|nr:hypothetical protein [Candidatus Peribacteria bacterium]